MAATSCSSWTGQRGLQPLPSKNASLLKRSVTNYTVSTTSNNTDNSNNNNNNNNNNSNGLILTSNQQRKNLAAEQGLPVLKINKTGKLQARRLALTPDRRNLLVTSHRITFKGLVAKGLARLKTNKNKDTSNNQEESSSSSSSSRITTTKVISLESIDRIQSGGTSHRFFLARREAQLEKNTEMVKLLEEEEEDKGGRRQLAHCLSIVYLAPSSGNTGASSSGNNNSSGKHHHSNHSGSSGGGTLLQLESLDLVVPDSSAYETILTALEDLTALHLEEQKRFSCSIQKLHTCWIELGKEWEEPISQTEFVSLCERLQVPLKRGVLSILFKEELASIAGTTTSSSGTAAKASTTTPSSSPHPAGSALAKADNHHHHHMSDKLSFAAVANLLESIHKSTLKEETVVLEKLWQELLDTDPVPRSCLASTTAATRGSRGRDDDDDDQTDHIQEEESISSVAFLSFLRSQQKEFQTSLEEATDLVHVLNHQVTVEDLLQEREQQQQQSSDSGNKDALTTTTTTTRNDNNIHDHHHEDRLTKSRFFTFLTSDANDLLNPGMGKIGADDMTKPLSHYWINTSHDTYLERLPPSFQRSQFSSYYTYQATTTTSSSNMSAASGSTSAGTTQGGAHASKRPQMEVDEQQYLSALLRGVRCLELDVWDGLDSSGEPVVARFKPLQSSDPRLPVAVVLHIVNAFLTQNPHSFPVILRLENHCTQLKSQIRLANLLQDIFRDKIATPALDHQQALDAPVELPSPEALRGKVVILGKRPKKMLSGQSVTSTSSSPSRNPLVCRDDFDAENDSFHAVEKLREASLSSGAPIRSALLPQEDDEEREEDSYHPAVVVGFNAKGPVRAAKTGSTNAGGAATTKSKSPQELLQAAHVEFMQLQEQVAVAAQEAHDKEQVADQAESRAAHYTHLSGLTMNQVKQRAAAQKSNHRRSGVVGASPSGSGTATATNTRSNGTTPTSVGAPPYDESYPYFDEEKSTKGEEGLEVHEVLPAFVEGSRGRYEQSAREAMESASREAQCHALVKDKESTLLMARENLAMAQQREQGMAENAKRARNEALTHQEHAETAKERVVKVRELLKNCKDQTSTAGNVVQTALTEAKISEKRAADAEARAGRAQMAADADRHRADEETRKEEALEQQVNDLHDACMSAAEVTRAARERVEKAAAMLERVNEQIRIIETSSQYRSEVQARNNNNNSPDGSYPVPRGGSFLAKHAGKMEERERCRELIREASEETATAEANRKELQQEFEDRAYKWRSQADQAAHARRTADRSLHVAEELMEQAEEEREAANLRHTARQRAEATVENKDSHRTSLEAQLIEAEKAAAEVSILALQSRKRAEHLAKEWDKVQDHSRFEKAVEDLEYERDMAKQEYTAARRDREKRDKAMIDEKRRLDTNSEVCQEAAREAAAETDRAREEHHYQHEAVVAYNESLITRREAQEALEHLKALKLQVEAKKMAVERAKEYKAKMDTMVEIPVDLARLTLLHSTKHHNWAKSLYLSNVQVHSFAQNVLLLLLDKHPEEERRNFHAFTKNHLTRIFPSWKVLQNKNITNYDPVFAWSLGCQLVASNLHSADESLLIADGRFRQNGSCGYVLKPSFLTNNISKTENDQRWSLHVISGHNLPKPILRKVSGSASPLVKISIYSGSPKETRISYRTRPARHVGLNPVWTSNNKFDLVIPIPSISMVSFSVWHVLDDGGEIFMGASAIPASCMREGFRSVALFDEHHSRLGEYQNASLLVRTMRK